MTQWVEIRTALADVLGEVNGLTTYAYAPGSVNPPALVPGVPTLTPVAQGVGQWHASLRLHLMVPSTVTSWQETLEGLLFGEEGVLATLEANPTLGLDVSCVWETVGGFGPMDYAGATYWATIPTLGIEF